MRHRVWLVPKEVLRVVHTAVGSSEETRVSEIEECSRAGIHRSCNVPRSKRSNVEPCRAGRLRHTETPMKLTMTPTMKMTMKATRLLANINYPPSLPVQLQLRFHLPLLVQLQLHLLLPSALPSLSKSAVGCRCSLNVRMMAGLNEQASLA
mmetsp:Transcript_70592/g.128700  ORF Transcript_70592/g.128700 Transcript_70592/m.128700 type:complete len:151 (-) Transcript_70592:125-577(-)